MFSNFHAPVHDVLNEGCTVLDSGCGPATWTLEMAEMYPRSEFHGIDVSAVYPEDIKPANTHFYMANVIQLPFPDNHFDYIHQRTLSFGLTQDDWAKAIQELIRVLKPGGWLELTE
ncbi:hypothetical protein DFQ28_007635, partial [Apophysomyces sp. BC1034]